MLVHFEDLDRAIGSSLHKAIHVWIDLCLQFLAFHRPNILDATLLFCPQPLPLNYCLLVCRKVRDVSVFFPVYTLHHVIVIFLRVDVALRRLRAHILEIFDQTFHCDSIFSFHLFILWAQGAI